MTQIAAYRDPVSFEAEDANLYRCVGNGPTIAIDPDGLFSLRNGGRYDLGDFYVDRQTGHLTAYDRPQQDRAMKMLWV